MNTLGSLLHALHHEASDLLGGELRRLVLELHLDGDLAVLVDDFEGPSLAVVLDL